MAFRRKIELCLLERSLAGNCLMVIYRAILRDVTERKKAEQALAASEEKYRTFIERVTDAFIALDNNWCYTYLNKQAGELIHMDPAALIGKMVWEVFPDALESSTYKAFQKAMVTQTYVMNVDYYEPLNLWQENHISPSKNGLSIFIRDISEAKNRKWNLPKPKWMNKRKLLKPFFLARSMNE